MLPIHFDRPSIHPSHHPTLDFIWEEESLFKSLGSSSSTGLLFVLLPFWSPACFCVVTSPFSFYRFLLAIPFRWLFSGNEWSIVTMTKRQRYHKDVTTPSTDATTTRRRKGRMRALTNNKHPPRVLRAYLSFFGLFSIHSNPSTWRVNNRHTCISFKCLST